ncbi:MAG: terminase small subunit [Candidatus Eisenbacteria bacterium]|uniref:Terminase small subunit n=1 Tax=Eiseniibacteriota bacterium TaxID=2212470 RepID=A0A948S122_UNCEI|nr:terminase small subunit [Candidatus Eisenbacteria bacterium]MBU1948147.1 terminase small subunit [Candidatus Eisenbacteria bacterium]MBU2691879.1 terminase small subunit [Candidatus Eisenbacteria bacterium]
MDLNKVQVAEVFKVNRSTVDTWIRRGCPAKKDGRQWSFDVGSVVEWLIEREKTPHELDLSRERARLAAAQAEKTELEIQKIRGETVSTEEVELAVSVMLMNFRTRMLSIPSKLSLRLTGLKNTAKIELMLKEAVGEALEEISEYKAYPD